jgi:squalene-associated FAD-dependent desaturase
MKRTAVIGAGWAGATAALLLARAGLSVTVFEATKIAGGRARKVEHDARTFDNGQHLLLGAYQRSTALIESLHTCVEDVLLRLPLTLHTAPSSRARLALAAPSLPAPWHLLAAIVLASGLSISDKLRTIAWARRNLGDRVISPELTVEALIANQPARAQQLLWEPLCIAALNTPARTASATVFIEVLRRAFTTHRLASDLLVPRVDLSTLLPGPALAEVAARGNNVCLNTPVLAVTQHASGATVTSKAGPQSFDYAVIATGPQHVARLLSAEPTGASLVAALRGLEYEPITTLHLEFVCASPEVDTPNPMRMLDGDPGQWVFWRRQSNGHWRASVVISAFHGNDKGADLATNALSQLRRHYRLPTPVWTRTITEKRATYACTPAQTRQLIELPRRIGKLLLAGDWCVPELPATLEAAVTSGENAAASIITHARNG